MPILRFTVDSALLSELGEKLVETFHRALEELIKNSYDADATHVKIRFVEGKSSTTEEIHIIDNGIGMTFDDVKRYWMKIATTNKIKRSVSVKFGRDKTGSKGIGRFSCRRLGDELEMITVGKNEKGEYEKTHVKFDWNKFEVGTDITKIECQGEMEITKTQGTGTILIIRMISEELKGRDYNYLKRQLAMLVANRGIKRKGFQDDPGFNIELIVPQFEGKIIDLRDELINSGWGTVTAEIDSSGIAHYRLNALGLRHKEISSHENYYDLRGTRLHFGVLVEKREQMRNTNVISKGRLQEILSNWGGILVKYKGFRVSPYGADDWLNIDHDRGLRKQKPQSKFLINFSETLNDYYNKRPLLNLLSEKNYVGEVSISDPNKLFELKASREGFIESEQFNKLKKFVRFGVDWATIYRDYYKELKRQKTIEESRTHLEELKRKQVDPSVIIEESVSYLKDQISFISSFVPRGDRKKLANVNIVLEDILAQNDIEKDEIKHLRLIASSSTALLLFTHEVKSLLGYLDNLQIDLIQLKNINKHQDKIISIDRIDAEIENTKDRFNQLLSLLSIIIFEGIKEKPKNLALKDSIENAINAFKLITQQYQIGIEYEEKVPNNMIIHNILEAELITILLNVISNSVKSIIANNNRKKIEFSAIKENGRNFIKIRDTGVGISREYFDEAFVPFIADPENNLYKRLDNNLNPEDKHIVGSGSGLGLSYIKEIIKNRNGSIKFNIPPKGWSAELEIILP